MRTVEEALGTILSALPVTVPEIVSIDRAAGRVLAEDVHARRTHPEHDISAMDGYAVRSADVTSLPADLTVIEEIPAGTVPRKRLEQGQAARIFTGAILPEGADGIALQEDVETLDEAKVRILEMEESRHIRVRGLDFTTGGLCAAKGTRLTPAHIGLLSAANIAFVKTYRRPRVTLLSTGSELVLPGTTLTPGQIVSSNGTMLSALVSQYGGEAIDLGPVIDDEAAIQRAAQSFSSSDICVTIGGASVGKHDLVQSVLSKDGLDVDFWKIAMRPGKPLIFGHYKSVPFLGLPGNPVSAFVCALLFLTPAIGKMSGEVGVSGALTLESYKTSIDLPKNGPRKTFLRAVRHADKPGYVAALPIQDSSMLSALAAADCLIVRDIDAPKAECGDNVSILSLK